MAAAGLSAVSSFVDRQYYFVDEMKNMTEAQRYCREKYTDLATVHSVELVKLLKDSFGSNTLKAWIGLHDDRDTWSWSLSNTSFNYFAQTSDSDRREHCTLNSSVDELWDAGGCEEHFNAICFDVSGSSVTFVFTKISSMNWTEAQSYCRAHHTDLARAGSCMGTSPDEAVQKEIMVQIKKKLGLGDNAELMWRTQQDGQVFHKEDEL
ncbi:hypothetical protein CgunFtcFv8_018186 [Champsocephalus gunnari]|uniref:C-type lectin domain-containing protein n=1 Tax=Champsocephalus gunnari TaxID=52237 RepID=A0AAN8DMQ5_CHAGU|nr:hypothetical protein CgunFtcFv8_018186 [Champsocephalus gunnari]